MDDIAVLIPCYNEDKTIEKVVSDFKRVLPDAVIYVYDNNSTDDTEKLARVRDHDNYEEKHVQDIITNFFLRSDSGLYTNTCHVTRMGEEDRTLLYVMDSSKFPAWISDFGKETGIEKNHE